MSLTVVNDSALPTVTQPTPGSSSGGYTLQINENISLCPFVNKPFPIQLYLLDDKKQLLLGRGNIPIEMQMFSQGSETPIPTQDICKIEPSNLVINNMGIVEIKVTFLQLSMNLNNRKFYFRFSIKHDVLLGIPPASSNANVPLNTNVVEDVIPSNSSSSMDQTVVTPSNSASTNGGNTTTSDLFVCTPPLLVVRLRLVVNIEIHNSLAFGPEEESNLPNNGVPNATKIWYKDEGGKDHGIDMHVLLVDDEGGTPVLQQSVPYTVSLFYSNGDAILNKPNILAILPENSTCAIDRNNGRSWKKIRINDISKNHQRQSFIIRVQPDITKNPYLFDIAGDDSVPIEVRSKRTKRQRESLLAAASAANNSDANSQGGNDDSGPEAVEIKSTKKASNTPAAVVPTAVPPATSSSSTKKGTKSNPPPQLETDNEDSVKQDSHVLKRPKLPDPPAPLLNLTPYIPHRSAPPPSNRTIFPPIPSIDYSNRKSYGQDPFGHLQQPQYNSSGNNAEHALQVLLSWTESVLHAFENLRWQHIGYQPSDRDMNSPDTSRPLYNMPNPNAIFDRLQHEYSSRVYESLNALISAAPKLSFPKQNNNQEPPVPAVTTTKGKREPKNNAGNSGGGQTTKRGAKKANNKDNNQQQSATTTVATSDTVQDYSQLQFLPPGMARGGFNDQMMQQGFPGYVMNPYQQFGNHNSTQMEDAMHFMYNNRPRANSLALYPPPNNANQPPFQQSQHHLQPTDHNARTPAVPAQSIATPQSEEEASVYYIVAIPYDLFRNARASAVGDVELYFPAYDVQKELIGFYTEMKDDRNATIIRFHTLNAPLPFNPNSSIASVIDMSKAKQFLLEYLHGPSSNLEDDCSDEVYSLPRASYNLEAMKHDAMVHYWLAEVGLDDF